MDYHMDNKKSFDYKALDATYNSRADANAMLDIESVKKCVAIAVVIAASATEVTQNNIGLA